MSTVEIVYSAVSRGYYQKIVVKNQIVSITKGRGEEAVTNKINGAQWARIVSEFKKINLETKNTRNEKISFFNRIFCLSHLDKL